MDKVRMYFLIEDDELLEEKYNVTTQDKVSADIYKKLDSEPVS